MKISISKNEFMVRDFFTFIGSFFIGSLVDPKYLPFIVPVFLFVSMFSVKIDVR